MFRLWIRLVKDSRLLQDMVVEDDSGDSRTRKIMNAIDAACRAFDLPRPIWLSATVEEFRRHDKCRFTGDAFMESIPFDYMEIQVLEEGTVGPAQTG